MKGDNRAPSAAVCEAGHYWHVTRDGAGKILEGYGMERCPECGRREKERLRCSG